MKLPIFYPCNLRTKKRSKARTSLVALISWGSIQLDSADARKYCRPRSQRAQPASYFDKFRDLP